MIHPPPRPARSVLLGASAILAYSVWYWSLGHVQAPVSTEGLLAGLQLILAALGFTAIGHLVLSLVVPSGGALSVPGLSRLVCSAVVGQVACLVWVVLRSGVSGVAFFLSGRQLPITGWELVVCALGLVAIALRRARSVEAGLEIRVRLSVRDVGCFITLLACMFLPLSIRELPRTLALSSDPDQHAFWASQILRVGVIPWDQGLLGVGPFDYPAGFSVLNAAWMVLSQLSAVEVVTVQPMVQFLWGAMVCVALAPMMLRGVKLTLTNSTALVASLVVLVVYWFVLPYGMQSERYHLSGTARLATSMLSSVVIVAWVLVPALAKANERLVGVVRGALCAATALIAMFNPMSAVVPAFLSCTALTCGSLCLKGSCTSVLRLYRSVMLAGAVGVGLLLCDPYFATRGARVLASLFQGGGSATAAVATQGVHALSFSIPSAPVSELVNPLTVARLLAGGLYTPEQLRWGAVVVLGALWLKWLVVSRASALRYGVVIVVSVVTLYFSSGLRGGGDVTLPLYLIQPYIVQGVWEFGVILGCLLVSVGWWAVCGTRGVYTSTLAALILSLLCVWPAQSIALRSEQFKLTPRVTDCGSFGCATAGDLAALSFLEQLGTDVVKRYPNLTFESAPKVLLLGHPAIHGVERWVFPYGASRIAPMWSPLPVAFFYGRGSPLWSYENYLARVCQQFDREWMRQNNIRYLFMPSSNPGCLRGRERVLEESTVLFERDGARVVGLF